MDAEMRAALAEPFPENRVSWKPAATRGNEALAVAYVDARDVAERLDDATDGNWEFRWEPDGKDVHGILTVCGTTREDVGEQGDSAMGATRKAAVSDALKRCAVQFGVGRYLYHLPATWVGYDGKRLAEFPRLPSWALPGGGKRPQDATRSEPLSQPLTQAKILLCPVHNVETFRREKDGQYWYSHRQGDGWCNIAPEESSDATHWTQNQEQYNQAWGILKSICLEYNPEMTTAEALAEVLAAAEVAALSDYRGTANDLAVGLRERMIELTGGGDEAF